MLVSVLINNYNYSQFLDVCLKSVLRQTYKNFEVIVYDDGSSDSSLQVLEKYKNQVKIIANKNYSRSPNQNQANAIYQAFLQSKGEIICLLDSDDVFFQNKVEEIVTVFEGNKEICAVQHLFLEIDAEDRILNNVRPVLKEVHDIKSYIYNNQNLSHLFVSTSGLAFRREFLEKMLPMSEDSYAYLWSDVRLMLHSIFHGKIMSIREPLAYYRIHGINDSSVRGSFEGHQLYLKQLYSYFNQISLHYEHPSIYYDQHAFLKTTFFYSAIDFEQLKLFSNFPQSANELYVWGAGEAGQSIALALVENNFPFFGFLDVDYRKQGQIVAGKVVYNPDTLVCNEYTRIIVSPYHAYEAIKATLEKRNLNESVHFIDPYFR